MLGTKEMSNNRKDLKFSQSEMDTDFLANLWDTRTSFWELLRRRTTSSSLSGSCVTSLAATQASFHYYDILKVQGSHKGERD